MTLFKLNAGFMPLFDSALLVLSHEKGFAAEEGLALHLVRETSWANIRDRAAIGHFDISVMLAPMPIAANLGLTPIPAPIIAPIVLGLGNNAITVSQKLWQRMAAAGAPDDLSAAPVGAALARVIAEGGGKLRFGVVHQTSSHNYELRYWLAASGINPDTDIDVVVLPPQYLPDALGRGSLDGYCVGEPWNSVGVARGSGHMATVKAAIWRASPDKVIGMRREWAETHPDVVASLIRAIYRSARWLDDPANHAEAATIMARPEYLAIEAELVARTLKGSFDVGGGIMRPVENAYVPFAGAANFPWKSHALWYLTQMARWGETEITEANSRLAAESFRPDLYRSALEPLPAPYPLDDLKVEGGQDGVTPIRAAHGPLALLPDGFFDGTTFDPAHLSDYLENSAMRR
jgi:two-component system, oxyanion-binding sensor